jgi:F-type H+-transporting ATPase subunit epsilon
MAVLHCVITTPEGLVFDGNARSVVVTATDGELGILPRHAPLIGALGFGEARVEKEGGGGGKARFFIEGGFVQVLDGEVAVLATRAQPVESLQKAAEEANVKKLLDNPPPKGSTIEFRAEYQERLQSAKAKAKLAG